MNTPQKHHFDRGVRMALAKLHTINFTRPSPPRERESTQKLNNELDPS